jgi:hypothetical protein
MQLLEDLAETASALTLERLEQMFEGLLGGWIEEALQLTGTVTLRKRRLPSEQVIWLVLGMALIRGCPIMEVARSLELILPSKTGGKTVAPSALPQARARVGAAPFRWLFERVASWAPLQAPSQRWRGLSVMAMDGSTLCVPDSEANAVHFGRHHSGPQATPSAYPMLRMVWLIDVHSRLVRAARFGPFSKGELTYAYELLSEIPEDSLVIMDRLYHCSPILLPLMAAGRRHFLVRTKSNAKWRVIRSLGEGDDLVEVLVTDEARAANPSLPARYIARAILTRTPKNEYKLLTSMNDEHAFPADEIRQLYRERWEVEIALDEVKTKMLEQAPTLRSRTVVGVEQETWGALLAYNLVRLEMAAVARESSVPPRRVSFFMSMRLIVSEWRALAHTTPGSIPKRLKGIRDHLRDFILPPRRSDRSYPRAVKKKESSYPRKRPPPEQLLN